jgi:hypothetical protein
MSERPTLAGRRDAPSCAALSVQVGHGHSGLAMAGLNAGTMSTGSKTSCISPGQASTSGGEMGEMQRGFERRFEPECPYRGDEI